MNDLLAVEADMDTLFTILRSSFLWVDYGQIEGFYDKEDIKLSDLLALKGALDIAIEEKRAEPTEDS